MTVTAITAALDPAVIALLFVALCVPALLSAYLLIAVVVGRRLRAVRRAEQQVVDETLHRL